jgi:hypothetical protein
MHGGVLLHLFTRVLVGNGQHPHGNLVRMYFRSTRSDGGYTGNFDSIVDTFLFIEDSAFMGKFRSSTLTQDSARQNRLETQATNHLISRETFTTSSFAPHHLTANGAIRYHNSHEVLCIGVGIEHPHHLRFDSLAEDECLVVLGKLGCSVAQLLFLHV